MRPKVRRLIASVPLRLALLAFIVYNLNLRSITSYDTYPTRLLPVAMLTGFQLHLDQFPFLLEERFPSPTKNVATSFMTFRRGHWRSRYPVMPALLATPVYALPVMLGVHRGPPIGELARVEVVATLLAKVAASLAIALSVALVFLTLAELVDRRAATMLALIYAFGTSSWSVSSQGLWQSAFSQPALALALLALVRARTRDESRWVAVAGWALAVAVACRPPMALVALVLSVYVLRRHRARFARFVVGPVVIGTLLVTYNLYYFGALSGGYRELAGSYSLSPAAFWLGLRGLLVSPNRGLFVFSPILAGAFAGSWLVLARRGPERDELLAFVAAATLAAILQYATFSGWHGAFGYSYRLLAELLPMLVLLMVPVWNRLVATPTRRAVLATVVAYSVAVQVIGAFYFPCGWFRTEKHDPTWPARFFSWSDMEMMQCLRAGPVDPDGLRAIRRALHIRGGGREAR